MFSFKKTTISTLVLISGLCVIATTASFPAHAGHGGAFLGGIAVAKIGSSVRDQRDYEEDQAYYAQQQAQAAQTQANAATRQQSPEERIKQLDKLAAGGYITPEEYKTKKQAILDSM